MSVLTGVKGPRRKSLSPEEFNRARAKVLDELRDALEAKNRPDRPAISLGQRRQPRTMDEWDPFLDG